MKGTVRAPLSSSAVHAALWWCTSHRPSPWGPGRRSLGPWVLRRARAAWITECAPSHSPEQRFAGHRESGEVEGRRPTRCVVVLSSSSMCLYLLTYFSEYFGHCHVLLGTFEKVSNFTGPRFITFNWLSCGVSGCPVCCCLSCSRMGPAQRLWSSQRSLTPGAAPGSSASPATNLPRGLQL